MIHTEHLTNSGPGSIGAKAHRLALLSEAGFEVPDGYVIGVEALIRWRPGHPPPEEVTAQVRQAVAVLGEGPLAVRSSAIDEDGHGKSFAGMYTTTLNVVGVDDVLDAISATIASQNAAPVTAYRDGKPPGLAVLIQPMLHPSVAGVAFTADPVTGDRSTVRVAGVAGIGEALVSGAATPDDWDVTDGVARRRTHEGPEVLNPVAAEHIAAIARKIDATFRSPQDIEWAVVDEQVIILQSRPITALPHPPTETLDGVNWEKDVAHCPEQVTPFGHSVTSDGTRIAEVFTQFGLMINGLETRLIGGELYVRPVPAIGSPNSSAKPPPPMLLGLATRVVPALRKRMRAAKTATDRDLMRFPRYWEETERSEFLDRIEVLREVDPSHLSGTAFVRHLKDIRSVLDDGAESHFRIAIPYFVALHELDMAMQTKLGWTFDQTVSLLPSPASRPSRELNPIRVAVDADPRLREALETSPSDPVTAIESVDPELGAELERWISHHGWRTTSYDAGSPALIERPGLITRMLLVGDSQTSTRSAEEAFERAASSLSEEDRSELDDVLARARWVYPMREDNVIIVDNIPSGLARRWLIEAGIRLERGGVLARTDDAAFLKVEELVDALERLEQDGAAVDLAETVAKRRAEWAWTAAHPGPSFVGNRTSPPDVSRLPDAARRLNGALLWAMSHEFAEPVGETETDGALTGSPGSAGTYQGPVRIVRGEADFAKIRHGDVLVCPVTTPAWTVLFPLAGALVTDGGGVLSHAAIIAREHGIPAVLGTRAATRQLHDGQLVEVNGTSGRVRPL